MAVIKFLWGIIKFCFYVAFAIIESGLSLLHEVAKYLKEKCS